MKILKNKKAIIYVLAGVALLQVAAVGYSMVGGRSLLGLDNNSETKSESNTSEDSEFTSQTQNLKTVNQDIIHENDIAIDTDISQEVQDLIKQSDPDNFERNLANYKDLLVKLDVHMTFKAEIERLLKNGHSIKDILTSYSFLYENYGLKDELEQLVQEKESGKAWADIFTDYNSKNPEFTPRSFESNYLNNLLRTPGISKDDIMIADWVASKTNIQFEEIIKLRLNTSKWKVINASLGIINSQQKLPYVPITTQMMNKYRSGNITEENVVDALIIATKLETSEENIVEMTKNGLTEEQIYAKVYEAKFY